VFLARELLRDPYWSLHAAQQLGVDLAWPRQIGTCQAALRELGMAETQDEDSALRIDKWLWAARFFKTRALAAQAVAGGKVKVNGERVKAARAVRLGDALSIHIGPYEYLVRVRALSARRGPAPQAALLYEETESSKAARRALANRLSAEARSVTPAEGRPTKKERRQVIQFKKSRIE
jgi:ribosome-associated heat shock protein Hsp15